MFVDDFILNGQGFGEVGGAVAELRGEPGLRRPYFDAKGRKCVTIMTTNSKTGKVEPRKYTINELRSRGMDDYTWNATMLRKDDWVLLDNVVVEAARARLRAWTDLAASNTYGGFDGMANPTLERETASDPGEAKVDMDGLTEGWSDQTLFQLEGMPLPITHVDFWFSERMLAASRKRGMPLNTRMAAAAGRRVAEKVEKTLIGVTAGMDGVFGSPSTDYGRTPAVYGYTNFPDRITKTDLTTPTGDNPDVTVEEVLEMRQLAYDQNRFGPFMLYHSNDWDTYMDNDYVKGTVAQGLAAPGTTLRDRLRRIDGITDVRRLDFLTDTFTLLLVPMVEEVARAVIGMGLTTLQWPSVGGMRQNFKVMAIMAPQLFADYNGSCGIVHATTS